MSRLKQYLIPFIILILACSLVVWGYYQTEDNTLIITAGWVLLVALLLWFGNKLLAVVLNRVLPWARFGNIRFFTHLIAGLVLLLLLLNVSYVVLKVIATSGAPTREQMIVMNAYGAFIFIPLFSIYFSIYFLKHWRESELEVERFQKETIKSQLASLKNHLDPHFLFNNLNILSALIDVDKERSRVFVDKFADVYRGILKTSSDDLIALGDELEFIQSYIFLIQTRFQDNISFAFDIKPGHFRKTIPPLTLQMLVENAIKHNQIGEGKPLKITIKQITDDYLVVSNTKNVLDIQREGGSGLENIRRRYAYFTSDPVKVIDSDHQFEVHIPLLEFEEA